MIDYSQDNKYALGTQKKVSGEVLRWHHERGTEAIPAAEYIERLENENRILKQQVGSVQTFCTCCVAERNRKFNQNAKAFCNSSCTAFQLGITSGPLQNIAL